MKGKQTDMKVKLSNYIIPSVISMVLVGTYTNIDGFFIGNVAQDDGLAAINIVWPIVAFITSLGTGIGIGGSVILNSMRGKNDHEAADQVKATLVWLLVIVGVLSSIVLKLVNQPLLVMMGAEGQVLAYSMDYAEIICIGAVFQIMGSGLVPLLRNEQKTYFAMFCCIVGLVVHLVLDVLLVEEYKLSGVAVSTVVSQAVMMVLCLVALKWKPGKMNRGYILPVLAGSTSPFGINFVPSVVLLFTNYFALKVGGTAAVSAYAVMSYAVYTFDYIFQGVCDGVQPVISYCCGAGDERMKKQVLKQSVVILALFAFLFVGLTPGLISVMPRLFAVSDTAEEMMRAGFWIYAASYPFKAAVKMICSYYYACSRIKLSNLLIYVDPVILTPLCLTVLPRFMGMGGIWLSLTLAQVVATVLGVVLVLFKKAKGGRI